MTSLLVTVEGGYEQSKETREYRHKTLSAYYTHLYTLHDYLLTAPSSSTFSIISEGDSKDFKRLVQETICAPKLSTGSVPGRSESWGTQQALVDRILGEVARRSARESTKDVLVSGDKYASENLPVNPGRGTAMGTILGGSTAILRSRPWRVLRSKIGDDAFRHILLHTSLFLPVQNNCFMQLSGEPVYEKYQHYRPGNTFGDKQRDSPLAKSSLEPKNKKKKPGIIDPKRGQMISSERKKPNRPRPADVNIARQRLLYAHPARRPNGSLIHGLPPQHILHKLSSSMPSDAACFSLLQTVFPSLFRPKTPHGQVPQVRGSRARIGGMLGTMRELLVRHKRCGYAKEVWKLSVRTSGSGDEGLVEQSHSQVCRFAATCLKQLIGPVILGGERNLQVFLRDTRQLLMAKQHENISLHSIVQGISINEITWLSTPSSQRVNGQEASKRRRLLEDFLTWLFEGYLIPLIRNTFYATETAATRYKICYFPHEAWSAATRPHFEHLQATFLQELDHNERYFAHQGPLGVAVVRLIPKPNGFRPIVNLGRTIRGQNAVGISTIKARPQSANQILRTVHQVLTFEKDRKRDQLGSCLFGTNEVFAPLSSYKTELLRRHGKIPQLYFVKMDIKAAFDTIKQDKMMSIISDLLDQDHDYCLMLYCLLLPPASKASQGSARRLFKQRAILDDGASVGFDDHVTDIAQPLRNAVLVDMVRRKHVTKEACLKLLRQHIKENVWQIGSKLYRQKEGIPQGSKISSLLCSIFYASLEAQHLGFVHRSGSRLLRYIDDFLFISDDLFTARRFVDVMSKGFPAYGAHISPGKTLLSFRDPLTTNGAQVLSSLGGGGNFPFCGFLIDTQTLDISMDHHRMISGPIEQSFALRSNRRKGSSFVGWLSRQLENRNHVAYLDTIHNDLETVHLNIYTNFALTAMKIPHYFQWEETSPRRAESVGHSICLAVEYTYVAGRARVKHASRHDPGHEHYGVRNIDFIFLAKTAIVNVLSKKASRMKGIVGVLRSDLVGERCRAKQERFREIIARGQEAIKGAKY